MADETERELMRRMAETTLAQAREAAEEGRAKFKQKLESLTGCRLVDVPDLVAMIDSLLSSNERERIHAGLGAVGEYAKPCFYLLLRLAEFTHSEDRDCIILSLFSLGDWYIQSRDEGLLRIFKHLKARYRHDRALLTALRMAFKDDDPPVSHEDVDYLGATMDPNFPLDFSKRAAEEVARRLGGPSSGD